MSKYETRILAEMISAQRNLTEAMTQTTLILRALGQDVSGIDEHLEHVKEYINKTYAGTVIFQ